ncbi:Glu-tRNA(Gln) amidotransferase subunit GatD, partial [Candidatus Woesearchaeota archaeon]|nr:Glu-tRNA(Gln) amidotransferase subunit GatD [Candidatus Woesearchaeota archaeon]
MEKIRIILKDGRVFEGILIPRPREFSENFISIKLKNGYNIGIAKENIERIEKLGIVEEKKESEKKLEIGGKDKPLLVVLHTGGTIASRIDYKTGGVSAKTSPEELVEMVPVIKKFFRVKTRLIANLLSENMRFEHYNHILREIEREIKNNARAIIIGHGTDTMHYTGAALHYSIKGLNIPIVLVGSQRSSDRPSTDAWLNLQGAAIFINKAIKENIGGVFIAMHRDESDKEIEILAAYRARKMHTSRRDAFKPINTEPVALVDIEKGGVRLTKNIEEFRNREEKLEITYFNPELRIGILKAHPHMDKQEILAFKGFDGLIIEGTGLGHFPIIADDISKKNEEVLKALKELAKN